MPWNCAKVRKVFIYQASELTSFDTFNKWENLFPDATYEYVILIRAITESASA